MNKTNSIPSATVARPCPACGTPAGVAFLMFEEAEYDCWCPECHEVPDLMEKLGWETGLASPDICRSREEAINLWNDCVAVYNQYALAQAA